MSRYHAGHRRTKSDPLKPKGAAPKYPQSRSLGGLLSAAKKKECFVAGSLVMTTKTRNRRFWAARKRAQKTRRVRHPLAHASTIVADISGVNRDSRSHLSHKPRKMEHPPPGSARCYANTLRGIPRRAKSGWETRRAPRNDNEKPPPQVDLEPVRAGDAIRAVTSRPNSRAKAKLSRAGC